MAIIGMSNESSSPSSAEKGDTISCGFGLSNNTWDTRMVWWAISDYSSGTEERLLWDEFMLDGAMSTSISETLTMPDHDLELRFHTGYVGETGWVWTDGSTRPTINHEVSAATLFVLARDDDTNAYLYANVFLDSILKGTTIGPTGLYLLNVSPGFHILYVTATGYNGKTESIYVSSGTNTEIIDLTPTPPPPPGTLTISAIDKVTNNDLIGARIHRTENLSLNSLALADDYYDTGYTTPHTFEFFDDKSYKVLALKSHYASSAEIITVNEGDEASLVCELGPIGIQCEITLPDMDVPDNFDPITDMSLRPKMLFGIGDFTYAGMSYLWLVLNHPSVLTVLNALAAEMTVTVNNHTVDALIIKNPADASMMLELGTAIKTLIAGGTIEPTGDLTIKITYPTALWFETLNFANNEATQTTTETITIPLLAGLCTFAPSMTGPSEIPVTLPFLPGGAPTIGDSVLAINLGVVCENLTAPPAVPIKLFLFGSDTPAISTSVSPTSYTPDLTTSILSIVTAAITAGDIPPNIPTNIPIVLECPEEYTAAGFSATMSETSLTIPLPTTALEETICTVDLSPVQPSSLIVNVLNGVPGLNLPSLPIAGIISAICKMGDVTVPIPPGAAAPFVDLFVLDDFVATLSPDLAGNFSYDIINLINPATLIAQDITEIPVTLRYPSHLSIDGATPPGGIVDQDIAIPVTLPGVPPGGDLFCDFIANIDAPSLPLRMSQLGLLSLDTTAALPLSLDLTPDCDEGVPTNPFAGLPAPQLLIGGVPLVNLPALDASGSTSINLATYQSTLLQSILNSLTAGSITGSLSIEIKYAFNVKYSTPVVQEWDTKTVNIPFNITYDEPPVCVLTADDYITCPNGVVIPIRMCLPDGSKVDIIPTPTCPDIPPVCVLTADDYITCDDGSVIPIRMCLLDGSKVDIIPTPTCPDIPPVCVLTADDYITCDDGSVIPIRMCLPNGSKVDIIPTPTCPGVPPPPPGECVITEADLYTCPDGSVIQLNKCVNGVKMPTGATCGGVPPPPGECVITAADMYTCPDGSVIQLNECVNGVKVPTGAICGGVPPPPPPGPTCTEGAVKDPFVCPDGTRIYLKKCVNGNWVNTGETCPVPPPPPPPDMKMVYVLAPLLTRVGKNVKITGMVYCGTTKAGGEKAWVTINGELLTTSNTKAGEINATWTPVVPGLYSICVTVPASSVCNAAGSSCATIQVVRELTAPEIAAAEAEFEAAKERIGQIMERI